MGCKKVDCGECKQRCYDIHGKRRNSRSFPRITSFFKVMIGDQCNKTLYLPPAFAALVTELTDEKTCIEDANEQKWEVTISSHNGGLAFRRGWEAFALDHGLEIGDFLVFTYIYSKSYFFVRIYKNSGCEIVDFPKKRDIKNKKRSWSSRSENTIYKSSDRDSEKVRSSLGNSIFWGTNGVRNQCEENNEGREIVVKEKFVEEPFYLYRELEGEAKEDRTPILDFLASEMHKNDNFNGNGTTKVVEDPMAKAVMAAEIMSLNPSGNNTEEMDINLSASNGALICEKASVNILSPLPVTVTYNADDNGAPFGGELMKTVKKECLDMGCSRPEQIEEIWESKITVAEEILPESFEAIEDSSSSKAITISCVLKDDNQSHLELPLDFPHIIDRRATMKRKVVYLRDRTGRLWPVLYHDNALFKQKFFTSGWEAFWKKTGIRAGDKCIFRAESNSSIIGVAIVRKS